MYCPVVRLKSGHMEWVRDFDFMLNLWSLPSPCNYYLFLRRIPYHSLWSHPRNRPPVNGRERQGLAALTTPRRFVHCTCSESKCVECTKYVRVQVWTRACVQSVYVVCVTGWFIKWVVIVMVMCYCYGDVLLLWCITVMVMCYCYCDVLLLWWCVTVIVMCYCYVVNLICDWPCTVIQRG